MISRYSRIAVLTTLFFASYSQAQTRLDSLAVVWNDTHQSDSVRLNALNLIVNSLLAVDIDSALELGMVQLERAQKWKNKWGEANARRNLGNASYFRGFYPEALEHYQAGLIIYRGFNTHDGKIGQAVMLNSVGMIYSVLNSNEEAIRCSLEALDLAIELGDSSVQSRVYNSLGIYYERTKLDSSLYYYERSLKIKILLGDQEGQGNTYANLGEIYQNRGDYTRATEYRENARRIFEETANIRRLAGIYADLGISYIGEGRVNDAIVMCEEGLEFSKQVISPAYEMQNCICLYQAFKAKGEYAKALIYLEEANVLRDSITGDEAEEEMLHLRYRFQYETKAALDSIKAAEASALQDLEIDRERAVSENLRTQRLALYLGIGVSVLVLLLIVAVLILFIHRLKFMRMQKIIVERQKDDAEMQKELIEAKNEEITSSIHYAQRIQEAILPRDAFITEYLKDNFILYLPKDIVAGDFYWIDIQGRTVFLAVADCTGHGVPGAMVSVVCNNALNRCTREFGLRHPNEILNKCRELVINSFQSGKYDVKDGMDAAVCAIHLDSLEFEYSGANNDIYIVSNGQIEVIPANRQPVGKYGDLSEFTNYTRKLSQGEMIFLFTDGFADQFGGSKGKKFKYQHFQNLLLKNSGRPLNEQKQLLENAFLAWKGNLEQIDDVCVIGLKI